MNFEVIHILNCLMTGKFTLPYFVKIGSGGSLKSGDNSLNFKTRLGALKIIILTVAINWSTSVYLILLFLPIDDNHVLNTRHVLV